MASLAAKDLQEKRWNKPLLLPLVFDIKLFRDKTFAMANEAADTLNNQPMDVKSYKILVECILALTILFNRRRIGDVQYLKICDYKSEQHSNYTDFENAISETEKILAQKYRRILNSGKGFPSSSNFSFSGPRKIN